MSNVVITVKAVVKPEHLEAFLEALLANAEGARNDEPGCQRFDVVQAADNENEIHIYEIYDDEDAFKAHQQSPHFQTAIGKIRALDAETEMKVCKPLN
jgi:autoinducer 2-degrading protein